MGLGSGQIADNDDFQYLFERTYDKDIGRLTRATTQALADNTFVAVSFITEEYDTGNYHSTSVNPTRITPTRAGYVRFMGAGLFEAQTTPVFSDAVFRKNGVDLIPPGGRIPGQASAFGTNTFCMVDFNGSSDYVEFVLRQDSAGSDNINTTTPFITSIEWEWVRDL